MQTFQSPQRQDHLTYKGNLQQTRYGWLRLTPAYSVHLVGELLDIYGSGDGTVLDPFCGTGTTALVCAERGIACDTTDINPFLLWLSLSKTRNYTTTDRATFQWAADQVAAVLQAPPDQPVWVPSLHQIEKWWDEATLTPLSHVFHKIQLLAESLPAVVVDLLKIAFCRVMLEHSNASFAHQSMSFKKRVEGPMLSLFYSPGDWVAESWRQTTSQLAISACSPIRSTPRVLLGDARKLSAILQPDYYNCVITSPPYPNRISYIRELRPYMYWLGYLSDGRQAGELDWEAIGGTWGCATSNLTRWQPEMEIEIPFRTFPALLDNIAKHSSLLACYVHKYFQDMLIHCRELFGVVRPGGVVNYIVGNSKFYDVMLPVEDIYAELFQAAGFTNVDIRVLRKRTSKKELFEFLVSAGKAPMLHG